MTALCMGSVLTGCQTLGERGGARTVLGGGSGRSNAAVVLAQWESIGATQSQVSFLGNQTIVQKRRARHDKANGLYQEAMQMVDGSMVFERRTGNSLGEAPDPAEAIRNYQAESEFVAAGLKLDVSSYQSSRVTNGLLHRMNAKSGRLNCVVFYHEAPEAQGQGGEQARQGLHGTLCDDRRGLGVLEGEVVYLAEQIRFDGGRSARSQMFASAMGRARDRHETRRVAIAQSTDRLGPELTVVDRLSTEDQTVTVEGSVRDPSGVREVRVNGMWAVVSREGRFRIQVPVRVGENAINVEAWDVIGNVASRQLFAVRQPTGREDPAGSPIEEHLRTGRYFALMVGVENYAASIGRLDNTIRDVATVGEILSESYGVDVRVLRDATRGQFLAALDELRRKMTPEDSLLLYYAGHGAVDRQAGKEELGYWLLADATLDTDERWVSNYEVADLLKELPAKHVIVVADSCFSGKFVGGTERLRVDSATLRLSDVVRRRSRTILSSGGNELVVDGSAEGGDAWGGHSPFSKSVLAILEKNALTVSGSQLHAYVRSNIARLVNEWNRAHPAARPEDRMPVQTPQYGEIPGAGHDPGADFLFTRGA